MKIIFAAYQLFSLLHPIAHLGKVHIGLAVELRFYSLNDLLVKGIYLLLAPAVFTKVYQFLLDRWNINALLTDYVDDVGVIPKEGWREAKLLSNAPRPSLPAP